MLASLRALPLLWRLAGILGLVVAFGGGLWGVYAYIRGQGYDAGYATASAECEAEQQKQAADNRDAIAAANKRLIELTHELSLKEMRVDDLVQQTDLATAQDPRGGDACLDADGVRRLNAYR